MLCVSTTLTAPNNTFFKNVVRQHNALAPAAIEQQQLFIIYQAYGVIAFVRKIFLFFKNVVRQHNAFASAAIEHNNYSLFIMPYDLIAFVREIFLLFQKCYASAQRL